jgi:hypothetical protein
MKLFLDFETYYSVPYSLTKMTTTEYVRDDQFYIHGVGLKIENEPAFYVYDMLHGILTPLRWLLAISPDRLRV